MRFLNRICIFAEELPLNIGKLTRKMVEQKITFDKFIRWLTIALLVVIIVYLLNYLSGVLLPFFVGWLLAYLLYPLVRFVQYKMRVGNRVASIVITIIIVACVAGGVLYFIIPPMFDQFEKLGTIATNYLHQTTKIDNFPEKIQEWLRENDSDIEKFFRSREFADSLKTALPKVFSVVGQTANVVLSVIASAITLLYTFFILLDYEVLSAGFVRIFPKKNRPFVKALMTDAQRELNNYVRGQGLVALIMGILFCIGFTIIDFPMAIGLGILIGIMDLVPYLHTLALIPTVFLALLKAADTGQNFWIILASAVAVFCIVQVIIDMIVTPKVMGKAMGLNPAILLLALSVWGYLLGFIGLILALPLTTLLIAYYQRYVTKEAENEEIQEKTAKK